jgi:hypothetical protein
MPLQLAQRASHDDAMKAMRTVRGGDGFALVWAEGRALPLEDTDAVLEGQ